MGGVCDSMRALEGKLNYLNMDCAQAKNTAGDALRDRSEEFFRLYYFALIAYFRPLLSVNSAKIYKNKLMPLFIEFSLK